MTTRYHHLYPVPRAATPPRPAPNPEDRPPEPALPPKLQMAANFASFAGRSLKRAVTGRAIFASAAAQAERRQICGGCPANRSSDGRCAVCGCGTRGKILDKTKWASESCPLRKW